MTTGAGPAAGVGAAALAAPPLPPAGGGGPRPGVVFDEATAQAAVETIYRAVLMRSADAEGRNYFVERLREGAGLLDVVRILMESPEHAALSRAAGADTAPPLGSGFEFVLVTGDPVGKVEPIVGRILAEAAAHDRVTVLTGAAAEPGEQPPSDPRVRIVRREGSSVFHLRAMLPTTVGGAEWIVLLEDHNHPGDGWFAALREAAAACAPDILAVVGPMDNVTTRSPWSWANFMATFGLLWPPVGAGEPLLPIVGNIAFRTAALPSRGLVFGAFENEILPRLAASALLAPGMVVDHVQARTFMTATLAHFRNARVSGGMLRLSTEAFGGPLRSYLAASAYGRVRTLEKRLRGHPRRNELPRYTLARVAWLNVAMAAGFLTGVLFGIGRAPWRLE